MKRRDFLKTAGIFAAGIGPVGLSFKNKINDHLNVGNGIFIGAPVLPEYLYENGISETLDTMQKLAGIQTVMTFSHDFNFRMYTPNAEPKKDREGTPLTNIYVRTNPNFYVNSAFADRDSTTKYSDRDILDELHEESAVRGMNVYARILEPYKINGAIPGFEYFAEVDADGNEGQNVCFNHPEYQAYWNSVVEDLIRSHPYLGGFKFGQERGGPLLSSLGGNIGTCFCQHCVNLSNKRGINIDRARRGFVELKSFGDKIRNENYEPAEGFFISFLKIIADHPDILSMEKFWMDSREEQKKLIYALIKSINTKIQVGWHIDHGMTWDLITRTFWDYSKMGPYSDWLSVALYFDSMGRRSLNHYNKFYRKIIFGDSEEFNSYPMYLSTLGYDPDAQPPLSEHEQGDTSFKPDYIFKECRRAVKLVNGAAKVHARIGFDMPGYICNVKPKEVFDAVKVSLKAGVDGLWCGREWNEIKQENAEAFGDAVKDHFKG